MNVMREPRYYKVKCNSCGFIADFSSYDVIHDYNQNKFSINCPRCKDSISVASLNDENNVIFLDNVVPIIGNGTSYV